MTASWKILVTGRLLMAHDYLHPHGGPSEDTVYELTDEVVVINLSAGAWHMTDILKRTLPDDLRERVLGVDGSSAGRDVFAHAHTIWGKAPRTNSNDKQEVLRAVGYLGTEYCKAPNAARALLPRWPAEEVRVIISIDDNPDDGQPRENLRAGLDEQLRKSGVQPWIVWKPAVLDERMFDVTQSLSANLEGASAPEILYDRVIAIISLATLQGCVADLRGGCAWQSTVDVVTRGVRAHPCLARCKWVIVCIPVSGAIIFEHLGDKQYRVSIQYDQSMRPGEWSERFYGSAMGNTQCFVALVARYLVMEIDAGKEPEVVGLYRTLDNAIECTRKMLEEGYVISDVARRGKDTGRGTLTEEWWGRIRQLSGSHDEQNPTTLAICAHARVATAPSLANVQLSTDLKWPAVPADLAIKIALEGATAVKGPRLPWAHFGAMTAFDPLEIDGLRSLQDLLDGYLRSEEVRPLSIAVFGPPGSGKSYGVKQIAETRKHLLAKRQHTFNLSQFSDSNMLVDALHQVRDDALTGKPPLVFWDEFDTGSDSHRLVWLRYFLAPMQDGEFVEGQVTHRLGRAVFVFAGGTARTMSEFTAALNEEELKRAKLPDFVSRLRGFFDVPDSSIAAGDDPFPRLRRAIVLHELMTRAWPNLVKDKRVRMQPALVSAFLGVTKYRHGMRSLEAIIRSSQLHGKRHFAPSSLPARSQLALHVDADEFLGLVR